MKIGDRVRLVTERHGVSVYNPYYQSIFKMEGKVNVVGYYYFRVKWDNDTSNCYSLDDLELVDDPIIDVDELFEEIEL